MTLVPVDAGQVTLVFPDPRGSDDDLVAIGGDLEPANVLQAYRCGLFPMGVGEHGGDPLGWWSPLERGVLPLGAFHTSRSLRRAQRRFAITVDTDFEAVVAGCADPARPGRWITPQITQAYHELFRLGWAHSIEVRLADHTLVGGLYGLAIGGLFAGESMFHRVTDASKVALGALNQMWFADGDSRRLIDVQWRTPHLASLGVIAWPRARYLAALPAACALPWTPLQPVPMGQISARPGVDDGTAAGR